MKFGILHIFLCLYSINGLSAEFYQKFGKTLSRSMYSKARALDFDRNVVILSQRKADAFEITSDSSGRPVFKNSGQLLSQSLPPGEEWMYVIRPSGRIYVSGRYLFSSEKNIYTKIFHSSLAGQDADRNPSNVVAAGTIKTDQDDYINYIDEQSGHYRLKNHIFIFTHLLIKNGFNTSRIRIFPSKEKQIPCTQRLDFYNFVSSYKLEVIRNGHLRGEFLANHLYRLHESLKFAYLENFGIIHSESKKMLKNLEQEWKTYRNLGQCQGCLVM